jgi:hypothetical protein
MPYQFFTYYIENILVIISIKSGSWWRVMVIRLDVEIWVIGKGGTQKRGQERGWMGDDVIWGVLGFVTLVHVWV